MIPGKIQVKRDDSIGHVVESMICPYGCGASFKSMIGLKKHMKECSWRPPGPVSQQTGLDEKTIYDVELRR